LAHFAPAIVVYYSSPVPLEEFPRVLTALREVTLIYMIGVSLLVMLAFLDALHDMYLTHPISKTRPIKGYLQVGKIILYSFSIVFILHIIYGFDLLKFFTGLGAMAAVLMLVFKDTILGLVASIQLSANDMLRPGDWIEMPSRKADGVVQDISLTTIKVQNWDKTITTIPTYSLVSDSFTNWRGMEEAEGRRIKKSLHIDMRSVSFYSNETLENLAKNAVISKVFDVKAFVSDNNSFIALSAPEHRTITNLGLFRAYMESFLKNLPVIHPDMTLMVHYLQATENGLPLEIVAFSKEKGGTAYERIQSEMFDHILAVLPEFGLRVFQRPTGDFFQPQA
jgi:Small-conductance mechanosensitive channel